MAKVYSPGKEPISRKSFSRLGQVLELPNLIETQLESFEALIQAGVRPDQRENKGIEEVFRSIFPITNYKKTATLEYLGYELGTWHCKCGEYKSLGGPGVVCDKCKKSVVFKQKYSLLDCRQRGVSFSDPLKIIVRLILREENENSTEMEIREIKEQKIYLGEVPLMTPYGTFIVNGTERVIVNQLHRSPGVVFIKEKGKGIQLGRTIYSSRIIPHRGSWLDFEFDTKEISHVRIDRRKKFPSTILLKALGYGINELIGEFYNFHEIQYVPAKGEFWSTISDYSYMLGYKPVDDILEPKSGEVLVKAGRKITKGAMRKCKNAGIEKFQIEKSQLLGEYFAEDIINEETGEVILEVNSSISEEILESIADHKITSFKVLAIDDQLKDTSFRDTLAVDGVESEDEALREIYKRMRPGDPPTPESVKMFFENLFFNEKRYDLSEVGRKKINEKLELNVPPDKRVLTREDILATVKYLFKLKAGLGVKDDIDHLGNRRVRSVGEQVAAQFRVGMVRMEKTILERMNIMDLETAMPHDLVNSKPITAAIKEFFASSQLSQFMDETNPLSGLTHKRRLSSLGPGGLVRERAGFEVRDVHPTHYGRVCPVETPEGPNIGLISSLATYARVNKYGFIETPYRKVVDGKVTNEVVYFTAAEEYKHKIAQANAPLKEDNSFKNPSVIGRFGGEFGSILIEELEYMDVSPGQVFSVAAGLIPFLEHDDANRALMGSNMQRQAVPPIRTEAPVVGTGMEKVAARYSGTLVMAKADGVVINVDARRIVVRRNKSGDNGGLPKVDIYPLTKFGRSNQNTCINQKPLVEPGQAVKKGDVLADGQATDRGELALGKNVLVGFMPWHGYNFEDAIILSESLIKRDVFTSIHVEEFEIDARDTKYGKEEVTRDIPGLSEDALHNVDESGIVRIGAEVDPGDILVCKLTPKGETLLSPEEKLLKAIFGEKAGNVMDTSFRVPPGVNGTVVDVRVFTRSGTDKDDRTLAIEKEEKKSIEGNYNEEIRIIKLDKDDRIRSILAGQKADKDFTLAGSKEKLVSAGATLTKEVLDQIEGKDLLKLQVSASGDIKEKILKIEENSNEHIKDLKSDMNEQLAKVDRGDELAPGVIKLIKVYVAIKRKMQVGDKMAGRHGNKGVVSVIVPEEDMPRLEDGTPLEILLNPLGVPSRMNVGQLMETSLGMAAKANDTHYETPVFDGASENDVKSLLRNAGVPENCMRRVIDGRAGEYFDQKVFVGYIYMMKLHHLVEDKMHARSTGPYSLVTQQPLGGKAQFGGQRLGEMEVWALEGYGAAYTLQEMLTVKSDDVEGRKRMYEAIVKGDNTLQPGLPESFNVLIKELQALCLDISLDEIKKKVF
ncbi:MAG: DNA-directed RNA polymerase subunit beta [Nitrospinota bacterium]|nr:DNA-directed RNA polymerase subunit beta [Nitrospinota bacterium]